MCQPEIAKNKLPISAISFLLKIFKINRKNTGMLSVPKSAFGNLTAKSFNPKSLIDGTIR